MNEEEIFHQALAHADPAERAAYLNRACAGPAARASVEALLRANVGATGFLDPPAAAPAVAVDQPAGGECPGTVIGPYRLMEQIGEGGFGLVFVAEQTQPVRRRVALKVLKPGMDSRQVMARFEAERQALALMDHPNIATVLDAGATASGRPYFVMELVKGEPITEFCDRNQLTPRGRLELFVETCAAVQHAHQKGIIHRDLKPSNVLVTVHDTTPVVKVIDFGIAKALGQELTDKTVYTGLAQLVGTPLYMSPEQAGMSGLDIDTRSDVYSLGVLLYELLTGTTPFDKERFRKVGCDEIRRIIREEEPQRPSTRMSTLGQAATTVSAQRRSDPKRLSRLFRGELDWVVMRCLEKDRNRRYESASALAADVRRYLTDEPVQACPPSAAYRLKKFARRNRAPVAAATIILLLLLGGIVGTTWGLVLAEQARRAEADRAAGERRAREEALAAAAAEREAKEAEQQRRAETQAVLGFLEGTIIAAARPKDMAGGLGYDVKLADAVRAALPVVEKSFPDQPLIEARLRMTMGLSFWYLGDFKTAIEQKEKARTLYTRHRGPDHPDTLASVNNLAASYRDAGRVREALQLHEETLRLKRVALGQHHPDTLVSVHNLACCLAEVGRTREAIELLTETLALQKEKLVPNHPNTLASMSVLASAYHDAGRMQDAIRLHTETLRLLKATLGPECPETLWSMTNLAKSYIAAGRTPEGFRLLDETLRLMKAVLGPDHPETLKGMNNLAESYRLTGRTREALDLHEETLRLRKAALGPHHPSTLMSMHGLANSYGEVGRTREALQLREETARLRKEKLGPEHPDTLTSMSNLAASYREAGRTEEAIKLDGETLSLRKAVLGPDHPDTLVSMNNLAAGLRAAGRTREALKLYEETLPLRKTRFGADHPDTLTGMNNLAGAYIAVGDAAKAVAILRETLASRERRVTAEPKNTVEQSLLALTHGQVGEAERARGDYAAAVPAYAKSVEIFEELDRAGALTDPYFRRKLNYYRQRLAQCRKAERAAKDLDFALNQPAGEVPELLAGRVRFLLKEQNLPAAVESAAKLKGLAGDRAEQLYDAACAYALCAGVAGKQGADAPLARTCADEAVALLQKAVAKGFGDAAHMKQDEDLGALREREEFKRLLAEMEPGKKN